MTDTIDVTTTNSGVEAGFSKEDINGISCAPGTVLLLENQGT